WEYLQRVKNLVEDVRGTHHWALNWPDTKNVYNPDPCKGHPLKKFIKECWSKCGCTMACRNRVVQRGLTCKLQNYMNERANEEENEQHTYPILIESLDNDWGSEQVLKDDEALCLGATNYGNVARFINHGCFDSNLIDILVGVETPDHKYYHIAFFTKRNVEADEELTWIAFFTKRNVEADEELTWISALPRCEMTRLVQCFGVLVFFFAIHQE
nr:histone-lysine N-methyltransferase SUVR4 [Tanacetum cinerariifolium]